MLQSTRKIHRILSFLGCPLWHDDQLHLSEWQALQQLEYLFNLTLTVDAKTSLWRNWKRTRREALSTRRPQTYQSRSADVEDKDADAEMADAKESDEVEEHRGAAEHSDVEDKDADAKMADAEKHSDDEDIDADAEMTGATEHAKDTPNSFVPWLSALAR